ALQRLPREGLPRSYRTLSSSSCRTPRASFDNAPLVVSAPIGRGHRSPCANNDRLSIIHAEHEDFGEISPTGPAIAHPVNVLAIIAALLADDRWAHDVDDVVVH